MSRFRRLVRVKLIKNVIFLKKYQKTYQIDERSIKQRYYFLYNDPSVDLEYLKKYIRDTKLKKDHDVREVLRKLGDSNLKVKQNNSFWKKLMFWQRVVKSNEPDYTFKE